MALKGKESGLVREARVLDVMGTVWVWKEEGVVGTEPRTFLCWGGRRDEVKPAKRLVGAATRWEETRESAGSPGRQASISCSLLMEVRWSSTSRSSNMQVTKDLDQGFFLWRERQACLESVERRGGTWK